MKIAVIGRSELMYKTALRVIECGYETPLIITAKESPESKFKAEDFKKLAESQNAMFINTAKINDDKVIEQIRSIGKIDIAVSINYSGIISKRIMDLFDLGILNAHGGDLPRYRGNACQAWAIINKENRLGLCVHKMVGDELDSGDIISREYKDISITTRIGEAYEWMETRIPELMLSAIEELKKNKNFKIESQSRDPNNILRCYPRNPEDGKIDWNSSIEDILRLINASSEPFSGAYSTYKDKKVIIWRAELYEDKENYLAVPGQVSKIIGEGSVVVICGNGKLQLNEIESDGKRTSKVATVINSIRSRLK
ncbi:formyltransferase family protein [soil metagenome]